MIQNGNFSYSLWEYIGSFAAVEISVFISRFLSGSFVWGIYGGCGRVICTTPNECHFKFSFRTYINTNRKKKR